MIKTCRIQIPFDEEKGMNKSLTEHLDKFGLKLSDISLNDPSYERDYNNSHFGNWCYVPAIDSEELRNTGLVIDLEAFILEESDISLLNVGDKVEIQYANGLAWQVKDFGTVYRIGENNSVIEILKKGTKSGKGWRFYPGNSCKIEKKK